MSPPTAASPLRRPLAAPSLFVAVALALGSGCGKPEPIFEADAQSRLRLDIRVAASPDPLPTAGGDPVVGLAVILRTDEPRQEVRVDLALSDGTRVAPPDPFQGLLPSPSARITVFAITFRGLVLGAGRSFPFELPSEGAVDVPIFLGLADGLSAGPAEPLLSRAGGAVLDLGGGRVLLVGGEAAGARAAPAIYDHRTGTVEALDAGPRTLFAAATALDPGTALVAGGLDEAGEPTDRAWLFRDGAFEELPFRLHAQQGGRAVWFPQARRAAVVGGFSPGGAPRAATSAISVLNLEGEPSLEPAPPSLLAGRARFSLTRVAGVAQQLALVAGGLSEENGAALASAEVLLAGAGGELSIRPAEGGGGALATLPEGRVDHTAIALAGGEVLIFGGSDGVAPLPTPSPLVFSPWVSNPGGFLPVDAPGEPALEVSWVGAAGALLPDGSALVVGGAGAGSAGALRFVPSSGQGTTGPRGFEGTFLPLPQDPAPASFRRAGGVAVPLPDGAVLVADGADGQLPAGAGDPELPAEIFVPCADADGPCAE